MSVDAGTVTSHGAYEMPIFHMWEDAPAVDLSTLPGHSKDIAVFHDRSTSTSSAVPSGIEAQHFLDAGIVVSIGTATLPANPSLHLDAATVITQAIIDSGNVGNFVDGGTVTASGTTSATENIAFVDANTIVAVSVPVTVAETYNFGITYIENFTFISRAVHSAADIEGAIDSNIATSVAVPLADEINIPFFEATTLTSTAIPTADDVAAYLDTSTATANAGGDVGGAPTLPSLTTLPGLSTLPSEGTPVVDYGILVDQGTVTSVADLTRTSAGGFYVDADTAFSFAAPSSSDSLAVTVASTITTIAVPSAADSYNTIDTGTVTATAVPSASGGGIFGPVDALSVVSVGTPSTAEVMTFADSATETSVAVISGSDAPAIVDASVITSVAIPSMTEIRGFVDSNTVTAVAAPSGTDIGGFVQANTVTAVAAPSDSQSYGTTDSATTTSTVVVSGINTIDFAPDAASVQSFGTPSSTDQNIYAGDSGTVTSVSTIAPGTVTYVSDDFNRTTSGGWGTAPTGYPYSIDNPNSADFSTATTSGGTGVISIPQSSGAAHYARQNGINQLDSDQYINYSWALTPSDGTIMASLLSRIDPNAPTATFYRCDVRAQASGAFEVQLQSVVNSTQTVLVPFTTVPPGTGYVTGNSYMIRLRTQGTNPTNLYVYVGTPDTSANPSWVFTYTDNPSTISAAGDVGIRGYKTGTQPANSLTVYDYTVTSIPGGSSDIYIPGTNIYTDSATVTAVADTTSPNDIYTLGAFRNSFEGNTNGTTITTTNSSSGGTPFNNVTTPAVYSNTTAMTGLFSALINQNGILEWNSATLGTMTDGYGRAFVNLTGTSTSSIWIRGLLGTNGQWRIGNTGAGKIKIENSNGGVSVTSTTVVSTNTWYRYEFHHNATSQLVLRIYTASGTTPLETLTAVSLTNGNVDTIRFQNTQAASIYFDDVAAGGYTWLGSS